MRRLFQKFSELCGLISKKHPLAAIAVSGIAAAFFVWIVKHGQFDTDILNLLPKGYSTVEALKDFNAEFEQARELTFVLEGNDPDQVAAATDALIGALEGQDWVARVFDALPLESRAGRETLPEMAVPLLVALPDGDFEKVREALRPEKIAERISGLKRELNGGSTRAQFELENDPLGILGIIGGRLAEGLALEQVFTLENSDGKLRMVPVMTRQESLDAPACREMMHKVGQFLEDLRGQPEFEGVDVLVTGRSAYVAEISYSMERDIRLTSILSGLLVSGLFLATFRSLRALPVIALILSWSCLAAMALGLALFGELSLISIAFFSIMVGVGADFCLLLYAHYLDSEDQENRVTETVWAVGPSIFCVAVTTAAGFSALLLSGSWGFGQLGVLVGMGVLIAATAACFLFFPLLRLTGWRPVKKKVGGEFWTNLSNGLCRLPVSVTWMLVTVMCGGGIAAVFLPWRPLHFDMKPSSLEPQNLPASRALQKIMQAFPEGSDPVMVVIHAKDDEELAAAGEKVDAILKEGLREGAVSGFASPAPLLRHPKQVERNLQALEKENMGASAQALREVLRQEGLREEAFAPAFRLLDLLGDAKASEEWNALLSENSPWWWVIDRHLAKGEPIAVAYIQPGENFGRVVWQIDGAQLPVRLTGWTFMLQSLVPWACAEIRLFSTLVLGAIVAVLALAYRDLRALIAHGAGVAVAFGGLLITLKMAMPDINLMAVLALPVILAVGVDYGTHAVLAIQRYGADARALGSVLCPVSVCAATTCCGFGVLGFAENPSLAALGRVSALGVFWCYLAALIIVVPLYAKWARKTKEAGHSGAIDTQ